MLVLKLGVDALGDELGIARGASKTYQNGGVARGCVGCVMSGGVVEVE